MTDFDLTPYTDALRTHAAASGYFEATSGHAVIAAHGTGLAWWCMLDGIVPYAAGSSLNTVTVCVTYKVMITLNSTQTQPQEAVDPSVANATAALFALYVGDFTLGGLVRNVDIFGAAGKRLQADAGWMTLGDGARYRAMIITLPLIINDLWTEVA